MVTFSELAVLAKAAWDVGDLDGCAACQLQMVDTLKNHPEILPDIDTTLLQQPYMMRVIAAALFASERGEARMADAYLSGMPEEMLAAPGCFPEYRGTLGFFAYRVGKFARAKTLLEAQVSAYPQDEMAWFYLGNACYRLGRYQRAVAAYAEALYQKAQFPEARANQEAAVRAMMSPGGQLSDELQEAPDALGVDPEDFEAVRRLPIFINCRDRVGCLQRLVRWLLAAGYRNLILLDNASTYPPLLAYYERIRSERVRIVKFGENLGHTALWESGVLERLDIQTPYVYTDPDVVPAEDCPPRFLQVFARVLAAHPRIRKVGPALRLHDIVCPHKEDWQKGWALFYSVPLGDDTYFANLDTTLALYRNVRFYHRGPAIRMTGQYEFLHLPWYYAEGQAPEDERYYLAHANYSSSTKYTMDHSKA